jgi:glucan phosphoethanolaminetransferase (alkaline phosphatase superfamily)
MLNELKENISYISLSILLSALVMLPQIILSYDYKHLIVMLFTVLLLFIISIFNKIAFIGFSLYISVVNIIIIHVASHWGYTYADLGPRIAVAMESPRSETFGYIATFIDYKDILNLMYFFIILYIIILYIKKYKNSFKNLRIIAFIIFILLLFISFSYLKEREPYNIIPKLFSISKGNTYIKERKQFLKYNYQEKINSKNLIYDKIIFILGESVNKNHMSIYGYNIPTTPFLDTLNQQKHTYTFNVIAPSNHTRVSVPIYMTKASVNNFYKNFMTSSSLLRDFGLAEYNTIWLSAQGKVGHRNDYIAACADDANNSIFINNFYNTWAKKDIEIVNYLKKNKLEGKKKMFLLHLSGSHVKYSNRYKKDKVLYLNPKNIIEEYDNSIYYKDYIMKKLFQTLINKNEKVLFLYTSDHGEVVDISKNGHGFAYPYKDEYDIPFVVYSSVKNERLDKLMIQNNIHYFNMENLFSYVEYISGIKDDINISNNRQVIVVDPKYKKNYDELKYYNKEQK